MNVVDHLQSHPKAFKRYTVRSRFLLRQTVDKQKMDVRKRITVSISTWFCIPEQGMKDMEILCRSSAFAVRSRSKDFPHKMHLITSSHNIAPWKYPKKHPEEWLQYINERHTYYTIETRNPDGSFMTQSEMLPCSYHHISRDLAVLHLETDHDELFETFSLEPHKLSSRELMAGDSILFNGYSVVDSTGNHSSENSSGFSPADNAPSSELDVRRTVPTIVPATFVSQSMFLNYARANHILNGCMSGGPVTCKSITEAKKKEGRSAANASVSDRSEVCGMFENVVPDDCEDQELRGLVSFVGTETIAGFLLDIEAGVDYAVAKGHTFLKGGEAAEHVGRDQDPKKMNFQNIVDDKE